MGAEKERRFFLSLEMKWKGSKRSPAPLSSTRGVFVEFESCFPFQAR
jgi:hypothetical protein